MNLSTLLINLFITLTSLNTTSRTVALASPNDTVETQDLSSSIPFSFSACIDDRPWIPYTNPNPKQPGTMQVLTENAARELGLSIRVVVLPWRRCLESVRSGKIDAMIGGGDVPYTRELAEFPKAGNGTDSARSLGTARVMLVKKSGSLADWDGKHFSNIRKPVAVAMGTQVMIDAVAQAGAIADEGGKTDAQNIRKLLQNRVDLMAGYEFDLKVLIDKTYPGLTVVLPKPLIETNYYLAFSKQFYAKNSDLVEAFWDCLGALRKTVVQRPILQVKERMNLLAPNASANALR